MPCLILHLYILPHYSRHLNIRHGQRCSLWFHCTKCVQELCLRFLNPHLIHVAVASKPAAPAAPAAPGECTVETLVSAYKQTSHSPTLSFPSSFSVFLSLPYLAFVRQTHHRCCSPAPEPTFQCGHCQHELLCTR